MVRSMEDTRIAAAHEVLATLGVDVLARKLVAVEVTKLEQERRIDELTDRISESNGTIAAAKAVLQVALDRVGCSDDILSLCELARQALLQRKDAQF